MPDSRKLLMISTAQGPVGGVEQLLADLLMGLPKLGFDTHLAIAKTSESHKAAGWFRQQGIEAEESENVLFMQADHTRDAMLRLRRYVRQQQPDIVNLHYGDNYISLKDVLAVRFAGVRRLVTSVYHPNPWEGSYIEKKKPTRLAALLSHRILTISTATKQVLLEAGIPARKITIVTPGARPPAVLMPKGDARGALGIDDDAFVVSSVARLTAHKAIDDLIAAFGEVSRRTAKRPVLIITGEGEERGNLERAAAALGSRVRFLGRVADVNAVYAASDLFVLPSRMEGFGLVYVEAAFHGVPSIGTDVGGIPEAVIHGTSGLLVPVGDRAALTATLLRLVEEDDFRRQLGDQAKQRAYAELTSAVMVQNYARALTDSSRL